MQPTIIGLLGKPLAGKDTVARALADSLPNLATISMGEVVREVKAVGPAHRFWNELHDSIGIADAGGIAPDGPIFECLTKLITEQFDKGAETVVWVAGPRSEQQLDWLDSWTKDCGYQEQFVYIDVPDEMVYERVSERAAHMREDDKVVPYRLAEFERITKPVIDRLREQGRIREISGLGGREAVGSRAVEIFMPVQKEHEPTLPTMARR